MAPPRLRSRFATSLRWGVLITLSVGVLVPGAVLMLYKVQVTSERVMETLNRNLLRNTKALAVNLVEPIWQVAPDLAQSMVDAQMDQEDVIGVVVTESGNNRPVAHAARAKSSPALSIAQEAPILRNGREIGRVQITISGEREMAIAQREVLLEWLRILATAAVSLGLILWLLRRRVMNPMEDLARAAAELGAGHLSKPIPFTGTDEIGRVGSAMERMRVALLEAFERLRRDAATLEYQVAQRTTELTESNRELTNTIDQLQRAQNELVEAEKLASLGRLVAGVAHELNTPLGNALTVVSTMDDRWTELDEALRSRGPLSRSRLEALVADTRRGQDILLRNVQKAASLVRDFKQVAIDQTSDARRTFNLDKVVEDVLVMVEPSFKSTPYSIHTDLRRGLGMDSYPGALGQALTNLVMNSLLHGLQGRPQGEVWITCDVLRPGWVVLSVRDDGWGMDEAVRRRVFDPFFTTKLGRGGTGLGMHIVHSIVTQLLGGQIDVSSEVGKGALMTLRLPMVAPERVDRPHSTSTRPA